MIDLVAVLWCASSITVLGVAAIGVRDALGYLHALDGLRNGRRTLALGHLVLHGGLLGIGIGWTYLGVPRLFDEQIIPWSEAVGLLIGGNVILAAISGVFLWLRRRALSRVGP